MERRKNQLATFCDRPCVNLVTVWTDDVVEHLQPGVITNSQRLDLYSHQIRLL
jgi:hypothetical protein